MIITHSLAPIWISGKNVRILVSQQKPFVLGELSEPPSITKAYPPTGEPQSTTKAYPPTISPYPEGAEESEDTTAGTGPYYYY
jgi:hypothetical protein